MKKEKECKLNEKVECSSKDQTGDACINCVMLHMIENFSVLYNIANTSLVPFGTSGEIVSISKKHSDLLDMYKKWMRENTPNYYPGVMKYLENKRDKPSFMIA